MHPHDDVGLWAWFREGGADGPALFLDRDGVIVEEVHFLRHAQDVRLMPGMAAAIRAANDARIPVVCITNQSGIARGHFGWADYAEVTAEMETRLRAEAGATLDAVLACGHHTEGTLLLGGDRHRWRKPDPGMLFAARDRLGLDLARSIVIGDRVSDLEAGRKAGLKHGILVLTGYGREHVGKVEARRSEWDEAGYGCEIAADPNAAMARALDVLAVRPA